jgi:hypothetical protein
MTGTQKWLRENFDLPTTPAPLDPSKVKAGDTVTVHVVTIDSPAYDVSGEAYMLGHALAVGGHVLTGPGVTLTDHQPAPEPEAEVDTLASTIWEASRADEGTISATGANKVAAAIRAKFVVIDPAEVVDELLDSLSHALGERLPPDAVAYISRTDGNNDRRKWVRGLLNHAQPNLVRSAFQVLGIEPS